MKCIFENLPQVHSRCSKRYSTEFVFLVFVKDQAGSNLDERPLYIQYVTEPGDSCGEINPLFLARRRRTLDHSLVAGGAQRQSLQACLPDGHTAQCLFSACSP